jgi:uncharacterized membrane protein YfcA
VHIEDSVQPRLPKIVIILAEGLLLVDAVTHLIMLHLEEVMGMLEIVVAAVAAVAHLEVLAIAVDLISSIYHHQDAHPNLKVLLALTTLEK